MTRLGKVRVLVVDDDQKRGQVFQRCLSEEFEIALVASDQAAQRILESQEFDVLIGANDLAPGSNGRGGIDATTAALHAVRGPATNGHARENSNGHARENSNGHARASSEGASPEMLNGIVDNVIDGGRGLDAAMAEIEAAVIRAALKQQRGNRSAAARQLQLPRQTLQDRMKKHGLWSS